METNNYYLFTDETGTPSILDKQSNLFILCGCTVLENQRNYIKKYADQIKFKYWGTDKVLFHSADIGKNTGHLQLFNKNSKLKEDFLNDLFVFLTRIPIKIICVVVDKNDASLKGWNKVKILSETTRILIKNYISIVYARGNSKGKIIIESSSEKDIYYLKVFNYFLGNGIKELKISHRGIKDCITSISFVTKKNEDVETEIADIFAYGARCSYMSTNKSVEYSKSSYEEKISNLFSKKLFCVDPRTGHKKKTYLQKIEPFYILPK